MKIYGDKSLVKMKGNKEFDFNLYPAYLVSPNDQMWLTPSGDVYVVREEDATSFVSHAEYAKELVNSVPFYERELEDRKNKVNSHIWQNEKKYYDPDLSQEWIYLINEKGYILFSPPLYHEMKTDIPRMFFPSNLENLSVKQVNIFLNFYEFNGKMSLSEDLEKSLYNIVCTKNKSKNR